MNFPKFRTGYDYDFGARGDIDFGDEPSLTIQSAKDECDINLIIDRANKGIMPAVNQSQPRFADVSDVGDYQHALNVVMEADEAFMSLPSAVRDRFGNDPAQLLEFLGDDRNRDEAVKLGLIDAPTPDAPPMKVEVVNQPAEAAKGP